MTSFWAPVPLAVLDDPRVRALGEAEQLTLVRLYLTARGQDFVAMPAPRGGEAPAAVWRRVWGERMAAAIGVLVEERLVVAELEGLRLVIATGARAPSSSMRPPAPSGEWQGKPSGSPVAVRARGDRSLFERRMKQWSKVPEETTWEAWLASPEGLEHCARRELSYPGYSAWVTPHEQGHTPGSHPKVTPQGHAEVTPGSHPKITPQGHTPRDVSLNPSSKGEEREEREGSHPRVTPQGHAPGSHARVTPSGHASPGNTLDALRTSAAGRATLSGAAALEVECAAVLARHGLTDEEMQRAGEAFGDPSAWWPKGKNPAPAHVTLNDLAGFRGDAGFEWRALAALVAHVRAPRRALPVRARSASPAPPPPPPAARATEDLARAAARAVTGAPALKETSNA